MAFLSGLLVPRSLRKGNRRFVGGKLRRIAHPYVLWSFIMIALWTGPLGLVEFRPAMVLDIAREPFDHLWYLYLLLGCYLLALATQRIRPLFLVIAATAGLVIPVGLSGQHLSFVYLTAFFMMGVEVATHPDQWSTWFSSRGASVLAVACGAAALLTPWWLPGSTEVSVALIPLMSVVLVGTWSLLSSGRFRVSSPVVEGLGRNSMVYYVVHWPVLIAVRVALGPLALGDVVRFVLFASLGFAVPALLVVLRRTWGPVRFLFEWPAARRAQAVRPTQPASVGGWPA